MKGGPAQEDWQTEANARGNYHERRVRLNKYLSGLKLIPLSDALEKAGVAEDDVFHISRMCSAQEGEKSSEEAESLCYICCFTFDFGNKGDSNPGRAEDNPFYSNQLGSSNLGVTKENFCKEDFLIHTTDHKRGK